MTIETDLSVAPYFDDTVHGLSQNYYKVLFKPSVPVQVRELNELQSILQNQIEEFGDNILKKGTIIKGCSFSFYNNYPYIKIKDNQADGAPVNPSEMVGKYLNSASGHKAYVLGYEDGFEQTDPDTKTLYLRYVNSGYGAGNLVFSAADVLTVTDSNYGIPKIEVTTNGTGYSNSDSVVIVSSIAVSDITGTLAVGRTMQQPNTGANVVIVAIDNTTYPDKTILKIRPTDTDFADSTKTANSWTVSVGADYGLIDTSNSAITATPIEIIGQDAVATATTDSAQRVVDVTVLNYGTGYYVAPYASVRSFAGGSGVVLTPQNYYSQITVYSGANSVGSGYAFAVSEGIVYQKGHFLRVNPQTVVVSKYDQLPNNVSVGFRTDEEIIDAYTDPKLFDNALGSANYTAPGADRLRLIPSLTVQDTDFARSNTQFFPIVEFSEGVPYKQNSRTAFNSINDELAIRTVDQTGDYVLDPFLVNCKSTTNNVLLANTFTIVVDPGLAYIDGYRIQTYGNYQLTDSKGIDLETKESANVSLNYGSYVVVQNFAGSFDFAKGSTVKIYDANTAYLGSLSNVSGGTITPSGNQIGTARIRALEYIDSTAQGTPTGSKTSRYRLYLFNIKMNGGRSFRDARSIYYDGTTYKGIADIVLDNITSPGSTTSVRGAVLKNTASSNGTTLDKLLFYSGFDSPLSINNISYSYRAFDDTGTNYTLGNNGIITISLAGNQYFPYTGDLSDSQKSDLIFYPLTTVYSNTYLSGTVDSTLTGNSTVGYTLSGSSTSFLSELQAGDYVVVSGDGASIGATSNNSMLRVVAVKSANSLTVEGTTSFANSSAVLYRAFPKYVPLPLLTRKNVTVNTSIDSQTLNVNLGTRLYGASNTIPLGVTYTVSVANAAIDTRKPNRNLFVKLAVGNNNTGFGYSSFGSTVTASFTASNSTVTGTNFTNNFSNGDTIIVSSAYVSFATTISTITDSNTMVLSSNVNFTSAANISPAYNAGPWCLGVADIFRLRGVYLANTVNVNTNSFDVTREFYIDHNQNPSYYSLGYLIKNKNSALVLTPQDYLLVEFDAFTQDYEGRPVHVNSYVRATLADRANTDSKALSELTNDQYSVNTFEIPELHSAGGTDYDLISYIDFRPRVSNTAVLTSNSAAATVNPAFTETFSSTNKNFPTPDSILECDVSYFLGRVDSVYIDKSGKIGISKGHPTPLFTLTTSKVDDLVTPIRNQKVMVLNNIRIPPYPSLEENQNNRQLELIDKRMINEKLLTKRISDKKITRLLTTSNIAVNQPKGYTMEQIGSLERRISNLEYYVALNNLELQIKDLNLPSSISANINRFKFGFFTDSYDNETYSDVDSQEYRATVENGRLIPGYEIIKIVPPPPVCSYTDFAIISQLKATGNGQPGSGNDTPVCVNTAYIERKEKNSSEKGTSTNKYADDLFITMANSLGNTSGQVTVYCYFYGGADTLSIYQSKVANSFGNAAILTTNNSIAFSNNDVTYLQKLDWFKSISANNLKQHTLTASNPSNGLKFGGKITFNHNPAAGRYYKFTTEKGPGSVVWRYRVEYPINVDCKTPPPPDPKDKPTIYRGDIKITETKRENSSAHVVLNSKGKGKGGIIQGWVLEFDRFRVVTHGLKPNTLHKVYVNKSDVTNLCDTTPGSTYLPPTQAGLYAWDQYSGSPFQPGVAPEACYVMSDARGKLDMFLFLAESATVDGKVIPGQTVTNPIIEIKTSDESSYAYTTIAKKLQLYYKV